MTVKTSSISEVKHCFSRSLQVKIVLLDALHRFHWVWNIQIPVVIQTIANNVLTGTSSPVATVGFGGLSPQTKLQSPQIEVWKL